MTTLRVPKLSPGQWMAVWGVFLAGVVLGVWIG
jgi:hypothetical protein